MNNIHNYLMQTYAYVCRTILNLKILCTFESKVMFNCKLHVAGIIVEICKFEIHSEHKSASEHVDLPADESNE